MFLNIHNYKSTIKIFLVFGNPLRFLFSLLHKKVPKRIVLKTPIGRISVILRNYESLKTIFSIFCREDYFVDRRLVGTFMDVGSNCGYSSLYFLTRNAKNNVICYEPDPQNLKFLTDNLKLFRQRTVINKVGIGTKAGQAKFYLTDDGKYSSLVPIKDSKDIYDIKLVSFSQEIDNCSKKIDNLIIKLDVEGIEEDLIKNIEFENKPAVSQLIIESINCSKYIKKPHEKKLYNGYVEHIVFSKK